MAEVYRQRNIGHCFLPLARNNLSCYTERINGIIEPLNLQCCNVGSVCIFDNDSSVGRVKLFNSYD